MRSAAAGMVSHLMLVPPFPGPTVPRNSSPQLAERLYNKAAPTTDQRGAERWTQHSSGVRWGSLRPAACNTEGSGCGERLGWRPRGVLPEVRPGRHSRRRQVPSELIGVRIGKAVAVLPWGVGFRKAAPHSSLQRCDACTGLVVPVLHCALQ